MKKQILSFALVLILSLSVMIPAKAQLHDVPFDEQLEDTISWDDLENGGTKYQATMESVYVKLAPTESAQIKVTVTPTELPITWSSNKPNVVKVDQKGVVTAVSAGYAYNTAKIQGQSLKCLVEVVPLKAKSAKLSKTKYTYNGKVQKPSVTVIGADGKKLAASSYTVSYPSGCKNVGNYAVTVSLKGKYSGTYKLSYSIVPKATSVSKLKAAKKGFTVTWKKQKTQVTGYQVQYSLKKSFQSATVKTVKKNKATSLKVTKLKAKKTYYVRVRTYKEVKVSGKTVKLYSAWSNAKKIKTK